MNCSIVGETGFSYDNQVKGYYYLEGQVNIIGAMNAYLQRKQSKQ